MADDGRLPSGGKRTPPLRALRAAAAVNLVPPAVAGWFRLVRATSRFSFEPPHDSDAIRAQWPYIAVGWHGQYLLLPALVESDDSHRFVALASRHSDGEAIARLITGFGHDVIRGSGAPNPGKIHEKGGIEAFRDMRGALREGNSLVISANFLRTSEREVSRGLVMLARVSRRPILPFAIATSRSFVIDSWDRTVVNMPFSKGALVIGDPIEVPNDAGQQEPERFQKAVAEGIDASQRRADEIAHGAR